MLYPVTTQNFSIISTFFSFGLKYKFEQDTKTSRKTDLPFSRFMCFWYDFTMIDHLEHLKPCVLFLSHFYLIFLPHKMASFFPSLFMSRNNSRKNDQKLPPSTFLHHSFQDIIKSWSSFNIHLHNRSRTLRAAALKGKECVIGNDYNTDQADTYNYLFIMHPLKHKCTLLSHSASYFTHKPGNGVGF